MLYKLRLVLQSSTKVYYKVCQVLQSASGITKCDSLFLQFLLLLQSVSGIQSVTNLITKCVRNYKV